MQCLTDFADAQLNYYNSCSKILQDLNKQIGGSGIVNRNLPPTPNNLNNNNNTIIHNLNGNANATSNTIQDNHVHNNNNDGLSNMNSLNSALPPSFTNKKKAKVLFDYEATDPSEISVAANQVLLIIDDLTIELF